MTTRLLLTSLYDFIESTIKGYPFPSPVGDWRDCRVFLHGLPEVQDEGTYPFVVIRWMEGEIESMEDSKTVLRDTVGLALGIHSPKSQTEAGILCAEIIDCLRRAIWKKRILAQRFELIEPLRCSIPDPARQVHNFHMATIETVWNYTWPPKALEEAGQSQLLRKELRVESYSASEIEKAQYGRNHG